MSNELMVKNQNEMSDFTQQLAEFDKIQDTCKKILSTKHYQALGEAGVHAIMARAKALGIHPFEALNGGFYVVQGRVGMSTEMMAALVRQRGHSIRKDAKSTNECVTLHGKRADTGDEWTCTFSKADAEAAGLWNGPTWKKYPGVMLYNRCMSMLFRQLFPDLSLGAGYVEDELREIAISGHERVQSKKEEAHLERLEEAVVEELKTHEPLVSDEQAAEIDYMLAKCDPTYKKEVDEYLAKQGVEGYKVPMHMYKKVTTAAKKKADEFAKSKIETPTEALNEKV